MRYQIEADAYSRFMQKFTLGMYDGQRLGQAFYNEFSLHKMNHMDSRGMNRIYEADGKSAISLIKSMFDFV